MEIFDTKKYIKINLKRVRKYVCPNIIPENNCIKYFFIINYSVYLYSTYVTRYLDRYWENEIRNKY